jgi:hypothetical protein
LGIAGDCSATVGPGSRVTWYYLSQQDRLSIIIVIFYYLSLVFILSVNVEINSFNSNSLISFRLSFYNIAYIVAIRKLRLVDISNPVW